MCFHRLRASVCLSVSPLSVYSGHVHAHFLTRLAGVFFSIKEVAVHSQIFRLLVPDHINFSYYITVEKEHLRIKACLVWHGFSDSKARCATTTPSTPRVSSVCKPSASQDPSLKGDCSDAFASSLAAYQMMSLATVGQRPSEAACHSLPHDPLTAWLLASF